MDWFGSASCLLSAYVAVLTVLADLKSIAVYSVYNLVVSSIRNIVTSLTGGMEAIFGEIIAKKEDEELARVYRYYELIISFASQAAKESD